MTPWKCLQSSSKRYEGVRVGAAAEPPVLRGVACGVDGVARVRGLEVAVVHVDGRGEGVVRVQDD